MGGIQYTETKLLKFDHSRSPPYTEHTDPRTQTSGMQRLQKTMRHKSPQEILWLFKGFLSRNSASKTWTICRYWVLKVNFLLLNLSYLSANSFCNIQIFNVRNLLIQLGWFSRPFELVLFWLLGSVNLCLLWKCREDLFCICKYYQELKNKV